MSKIILCSLIRWELAQVSFSVAFVISLTTAMVISPNWMALNTFDELQQPLYEKILKNIYYQHILSTYVLSKFSGYKLYTIIKLVSVFLNAKELETEN